MRTIVLFFCLLTATGVQAQRPECEWCPVLDTPQVMTWDIRIADSTEPGEQIEVSGRVFKSDGRTPARDVVLYLYHTNNKGIYPRPENAPPESHAYWHGHLRGWLKTNERGEYKFRTIKPAPYPNSTIPAHIHCVVKDPARDTGYYVADFLFAGDPYLPKQSAELNSSRVVRLILNDSAMLVGKRDIILAE